jgi:hypothetical protein
VRLVDARRRILFEAEVAHEEEAIELLRVLGFDAKSHRAEFHGASPLFQTVGRQIGWSLAAFALCFVSSGMLATSLHLGSALLWPLLPLFFVGLIPSKIIVGVDGILVRWLWRSRFIPMSEIAKLVPEGDRAIGIHLRSGERVLVYTTPHQRYKHDSTIQHRDAVLARMAEALATFREHGTAVDVSALVARGGRTRGQWLDALKKLRDGEGGYRHTAVRDDDLWRIVEDPAAPADARAGAAMVLKRTLDDEGRARVRVAAEATASPKLRVVLDAAGADDDARLEEAVAELEPADAQRQREAAG